MIIPPLLALTDLGLQVPFAPYTVSLAPQITCKHSLVCLPFPPMLVLFCLQDQVETLQ